MYRILEPIKINPIYQLSKCILNLSDLDIIIDFINNTTLTVSNIMSFIKHNHSYALNILYYIPASYVLEMYQDYNFLVNHMNEELYDYIIKKTNWRLMMKLQNEGNYREELIRLNNNINDIYNFTDIYFNKRFNAIEKKLNFIDFSKYYVGSDTLLEIAQRRSPKIIKLYPKERIINFTNSLDNKTRYYTDDNHRIICCYEDFLIIIDNYFYQNIGEILLEKDTFALDKVSGDIYGRIETYQSLDTILQTETLINKNLLIPLRGLKGTFLKYRFNRQSFTCCYVCKKVFDNEVTYDRYIDMCLDCAQFNYSKRIKTADLRGCVSFISGIRQKIGLEIALKMLRAGSKIIGTTRFPYATHYNFMKQPDYNKWKDNLIICQCDFLDIGSVMKLSEFLKTQNINIFINNTCQTIRASEYYYQQLHNLESLVNDIIPTNLLAYKIDGGQLISYDPKNNNHKSMVVCKCNHIDNNNLALVDNKIKSSHIKFNQFNDIQDIDIREQSSWMENLTEIDPGEILEAIAINQTVPILLINQIKKHMSKPRFIIQVTCNEGSFNISKESTHPHTNMCKAAMNMLIRTLAEEKEEGQYVYSINPGFISGINPKSEQYHFPLSAEDGAARILFPIIEYYNGTPLNKDWIYIKNFKKDEW